MKEQLKKWNTILEKFKNAKKSTNCSRELDKGVEDLSPFKTIDFTKIDSDDSKQTLVHYIFANGTLDEIKLMVKVLDQLKMIQLILGRSKDENIPIPYKNIPISDKGIPIPLSCFVSREFDLQKKRYIFESIFHKIIILYGITGKQLKEWNSFFDLEVAIRCKNSLFNKINFSEIDCEESARTLTHLVCINGSVKQIEVVIEILKKRKIIKSVLEKEDKYGKQPLDYIKEQSDLSKEIYLGMSRLIQDVTKNKKRAVDQGKPGEVIKYTLAHFTCEYGSLDLIRLMVKDLVDKKTLEETFKMGEVGKKPLNYLPNNNNLDQSNRIEIRKLVSESIKKRAGQDSVSTPPSTSIGSVRLRRSITSPDTNTENPNVNKIKKFFSQFTRRLSSNSSSTNKEEYSVLAVRNRSRSMF